MQQSSVLHVSEPIEEYKYPIAHFSIDDKIVNEYKNYIELDYAGGGVVATNQDLLKFMQALVKGDIISKDTLEIMKTDVDKLFMGINYGYGIWKLKTIPILMPKKYNAWGCAGATGAFMFYHPDTNSYLIGNFNDVSFKTKGIRFMIKVIKQLVKLDNN
jgi:D-alanyl-D-alanine carboxypeptidase